jgi:hypothetical protein
VTLTTLSSRGFNQDPNEARKAAQYGPVFITDCGRPAHVLLTIEQYQALTGVHTSIVDLLAQPVDAFDFESPKAFDSPYKPADLS